MTTSGGNWFTVSSGTGQTLGNLVVSVNEDGLASGTTYNGHVTITGANTELNAITIPVTLTLAADSPPVLGVSLSRFQLSYAQGGSSEDHQQLVVSNIGTGTLWLDFEAQTTSCGAWLTRERPRKRTQESSVIDFTWIRRGCGNVCRADIVTGDADQKQTISVTIVISGESHSLLLSQTGLDFQVATGSLPTARRLGL